MQDELAPEEFALDEEEADTTPENESELDDDALDEDVVGVTDDEEEAV